MAMNTTNAMNVCQAYRLEASRERIASNMPYFACLLLMADVHLDNTVPSACTDGFAIRVNEGFMAELSSAQLDGVLVHEVLHCAMLHIPRRGHRDPHAWNIAADIHVNGVIRKINGLALPKGAIIDPKLEDMCVEDIYEVIARCPNPAARSCAMAGDLLPAAGTPQGGKGTAPCLAGHWAAARQRAEVAAGTHTIGLHANRDLQRMRAPLIDWRSMLWRSISAMSSDYNGFDRRFIGRGLYLDALESTTIRVEACIDTSGSIDNALLGMFAAALRNLVACLPEVQCRLRWCDCNCSGPVDIRSHGDIPVATGGGGTSFIPFFRDIEKECSSGADPMPIAVYFTDGFGSFPAEAPRGLRVIWVVPPQGASDDSFPFGEVIRMA